MNKQIDYGDKLIKTMIKFGIPLRHYDSLVKFIDSEKHSSYTQAVNETIEKVKEMIGGEDEDVTEEFDTQKELDTYFTEINSRNELRSELRQQLETLKGEMK